MRFLKQSKCGQDLPRPLTALGVLGFLFLTTMGLSTTALAEPGPCTGPPQDRPAECDDDSGDGDSGSEDEVTLDITYEFGTLSSGACTAPDCVSTMITATGTVDCGSHYCDFNSTSVDDIFMLPSGLRDLLFATEWRGTPLDPDQCFGSSPTDPAGGTALIDNTLIFLRRFHDGETPWDAKVDGLAFDVEGEKVRDYGFTFRGCGATGCGDFAPGSMAGEYEGGTLIRIGVTGNDNKLKSVPCRCTKSNTPDCPEDVPVPTPPIRITVSEVP